MVKEMQQYEELITNIDYALDGIANKVILITSSVAKEGKTNLSIKLAQSIAINGQTVLLIDMNLRNCDLSNNMNLKNKLGIIDFVLEKKELSQLIQNVGTNFDILSSGANIENQFKVLQSKKIKELIDLIKIKYDYIIIDSTEILNFSDAKIISAYTDGILLVTAGRKTKVDDIKRAKKELQRIKANIIGTVLNT